MRLEKILDILYGSLLNKPYISSFLSISCEISAVKNGALFFAFNNDDIDLAIKNGAYGIVFNGESDISDNEIAWIKVDSMDKSIFRLIRYLVLESNYIFLMMNVLEIDSINKIMQGKENVKILLASHFNDALNYFFNNYINFKNIESKSTKPQIIISNIKELEKIEVLKICSIFYTQEMQARNYDFTNNKFIKVIDKNTKLHIISYNIFETKIYFDNKLYTLNYPYIFTPFLQSAISSISYVNDNFKADITYSVKENIKYFESAFLDSNDRFSSSQRQKAVIFLPNTKIFSFISLSSSDFAATLKDEIKKIINIESKFFNILMSYFRIYLTHQKVLICYKNGTSIKKPFSKCIIFPFPHIAHLRQILNNIPFDIAILCNVNKNDFLKDTLIKQDSKQKSLF